MCIPLVTYYLKDNIMIFSAQIVLGTLREVFRLSDRRIDLSLKSNSDKGSVLNTEEILF